MISENESDSSFPKGQFHLRGFSERYRLNRNENGGRIIVLIHENLPSKHIESQMRIEGKNMALMLLL